MAYVGVPYSDLLQDILQHKNQQSLSLKSGNNSGNNHRNTHKILTVALTMMERDAFFLYQLLLKGVGRGARPGMRQQVEFSQHEEITSAKNKGFPL